MEGGGLDAAGLFPDEAGLENRLAAGRVRKRVPLVDGDAMPLLSLEFLMFPVIRPDAYRKRTACMVTYKAGPLKASNILRVIRTRVALGSNACPRSAR